MQSVASNRGRPRSHFAADDHAEQEAIDIALAERIDELRMLKFSWKLVAAELGINRQWLYRWRVAKAYEDPFFDDITDEDLDELVGEYIGNNPYRGERDLGARLFAEQNLRVTRSRLRAAVQRVDPLGRQNRCVESLLFTQALVYC